MPRSTPLHRLCGFLWGAVVTGKINGQGIRGKSTLHCPALQPTEQLCSLYVARIIELQAVPSSVLVSDKFQPLWLQLVMQEENKCVCEEVNFPPILAFPDRNQLALQLKLEDKS